MLRALPKPQPIPISRTKKNMPAASVRDWPGTLLLLEAVFSQWRADLSLPPDRLERQRAEFDLSAALSDPHDVLLLDLLDLAGADYDEVLAVLQRREPL